MTLIESGVREFFNPAALLGETQPLVSEISSKSDVHVHALSVGAYFFAMATVSANRNGIPLDSVTSIIWVG